MNIKSLLLGSAAALAAVTGARAADAVVVAEPEPVEYVRVCDTYGAGFFYIPGTETCMRIGGLLRYDIDWNNAPDVVYAGTTDFDIGVGPVNVFGIPGFFNGVAFVIVRDPEDDTEDLVVGGLDEGWAKSATVRVNVDVRSETEFGTFRRFIRLEGIVPSGQNASDVYVAFAYIELGGLLVGLYDTLYDGEMSPEFDVGGGSPVHQIRYTFAAGNGITAQLSLEEQDYNLDYTPNVVGKLMIEQGWGSAAAFAAYDATTEEFGLKALAAFKVNDAITLEAMATYESGSGDFSVLSGWQGNVAEALAYFPAPGGGWATAVGGYEYSLAAAVSFQATEKLGLKFGGQYFGDAHFNGSDDYAVGGQVDYTVVENLLLRGQVRYNGGDSQDFWDGKIRLESSF